MDRPQQYAVSDAALTALSSDDGADLPAVQEYARQVPDAFFKELIRHANANRGGGGGIGGLLEPVLGRALSLIWLQLPAAPLAPDTRNAIRDLCTSASADRNLGDEAATTANRILSVVSSGALAEPKSKLGLPPEPPKVKGPATAAPAPLYASLPAFRPHVTAQRGRKLVSLSQPLRPEDLHRVVEGLNPTADEGIEAAAETMRELYGPLRPFDDYIDHPPAPISQTRFESQLRVLQSYYSDYDRSPRVAEAASTIIRALMDGYAHRVPLLGGFASLREVSFAFIPVFRSLVVGDYLCVQKQAYTILATAAAHVHMVDRVRCFAGATQAIEEEIAWLTRRVVEYQYLRWEPDDRLWLTALKCCLVVMPSESADWARIHLGALRAMASIPAVAALYPDAFDLITAAIALHVETAVRAGGRGSATTETSFHLGGEAGLTELLAAAPTCESARSVVRAIATFAGLVPSATDAGAGSVSERAWQVLEHLQVPWCLHLLAAQPYAGPGSTSLSAAAKELTAAVVSDAEREQDAKTHLSMLLAHLTQLLLDAQRLPPAVLRSTGGGPPGSAAAGSDAAQANAGLRSTSAPSGLFSPPGSFAVPSSGSSIFPGIAGVASSDVASTVMAMLKDETDGDLRRLGVRVACAACRAEWGDPSTPSASILLGAPQGHVGRRRSIGGNLESTGLGSRSAPGPSDPSHQQQVHAGRTVKEVVESRQLAVQAAVPALLRGVGRVLSGSHPPSCKAHLLASLSFPSLWADRAPVSPAGAMALYRGVLESIGVVAKLKGMNGDVSAMLRQDSLGVWSSVVDAGLEVATSTDGTERQPLVWALYWLLRNTDGTGASCSAVREARHVLLGLLSTEARGVLRWGGRGGIDVWHRVMLDPYPPCSVVGAQQLLRVSATTHFTFYEATVMSEGNAVTNPVDLAQKVYRRVYPHHQ